MLVSVILSRCLFDCQQDDVKEIKTTLPNFMKVDGEKELDQRKHPLTFYMEGFDVKASLGSTHILHICLFPFA